MTKRWGEGVDNGNMGAHVSSLPRTSVCYLKSVYHIVAACVLLGTIKSSLGELLLSILPQLRHKGNCWKLQARTNANIRHKCVSPLFSKPLGIDSLCATLPLPFCVSSIHASFLFLLRSRWVAPAVLLPVVTHAERKPQKAAVLVEKQQNGENLRVIRG